MNVDKNDGKQKNGWTLPRVLDPAVADVNEEASQADDVDDPFYKCEARKLGTTFGTTLGKHR